MKCGYKHCKHEGEEAGLIKFGSRYWHQDCHDENEWFKKAIDVFYRRVDDTVIMNQLRRTLNEMVYNKGIDPELIAYGINYYVDHKIPLRYPGGLWYVVKNEDMKKDFARKKAQNIQTKVEITGENLEPDFTYQKVRKKSIGDLFDE